MAAILLYSVPALADFAEGLRAYDGGDYATTYREWSAAAKAGDVDAMNGLGGLYASGFGVKQDFAQSARWYERAARKGHVTAQLNLGDYYARGRGVKRDLVKAYVWLTLSAGQGNEWAADRRREIAKSMSPTQIAAAEAEVRAFRLSR